MPFVGEILKYKSLSIVGLEKNTGKTECLNYILRRLKNSGKKIAVTSIGVDGESVDIVKNTRKPEIELFEDIVFITAENYYKRKSLTSEILELSAKRTALGRLVTARSLGPGKVIFSGPSDTRWLKTCIDNMARYQVDTTIVDGAVSRMSLASPAVTEGMILATGASVSASIHQLVKKTKFVYDLINIPAFDHRSRPLLTELETGIWGLGEDGQVQAIKTSSVFLLDKQKEDLLNHGNTLYFTGAVSDKLLNFLKSQKNIADMTVVVRDFTRLFVSPEALNDFRRRGGRLFVLFSTRIIAVCVNPLSPDGYLLDSAALRSGLSAELNVPVYDIKNLQA